MLRDARPSARAPAAVDWRRVVSPQRSRAHLFVYGTLERASVLRSVTGRMFDRRDADLEGYRCFCLPQRPYPGIVSCAGAVTRGTLYLDVSAAAMDLLDRWEDEFYERREVRVRVEGGGPCTAFAYVVPRRRSELITESPWRRMR